MNRPDYDRSIVNLMASLAHAFGAEAGPHHPLAELPPERLHGRPVVLLVIDGMGAELLERHPASRLRRHLETRLTSVFPSTTAAALTTFATAAAPLQHGVTGWFMWLKELGSVATILPFHPRHGGSTYAGITPGQLVGCPPLSERVRLPCGVVSPEYIVNSDFSRFFAGSAARYAHHGLDSLFGGLEALVRSQGAGYWFGYWPMLDTLAHERGAGSDEVARHFLEIDAAFGRFADALAGSGATLLVTADHGLIDTAPDRIVSLDAHPDLAATLTMPLCGEPRAAFCYVRPGRVRQFQSYVEGELGDACELVASERLIDEGWLGRGRPDPRTADRIGDFLLLMRDNRVVQDRLAVERPFMQIGVHGGLSPQELWVPLVVVET